MREAHPESVVHLLSPVLAAVSWLAAVSSLLHCLLLTEALFHAGPSSYDTKMPAIHAKYSALILP